MLSRSWRFIFQNFSPFPFAAGCHLHSEHTTDQCWCSGTSTTRARPPSAAAPGHERLPGTSRSHSEFTKYTWQFYHIDDFIDYKGKWSQFFIQSYLVCLCTKGGGSRSSQYHSCDGNKGQGEPRTHTGCLFVLNYAC